MGGIRSQAATNRRFDPYQRRNWLASGLEQPKTTARTTYRLLKKSLIVASATHTPISAKLSDADFLALQLPRSTRCWSDWRKLSSAANRPDFNSLKPFFDAKNGDIVEIDITELKSWYKVMLREDAYMYGGEFVKQMRHLFPEHLDRIEQIDDDFQCVDFQHTGGAADDSLRGFSSTANFYTCINDQGIIVHTIDGYVKRVKFPDGVELSVD